MPTLATGATNTHSRVEQAGFSLIEMLVVVFIIALASTVVVLNMPSASSVSTQQAEDLARDLQRASRESIASGEPLGLTTDGGTYMFLRYRDDVWSVHSEATALNDAGATAFQRTTMEINPLGDVVKDEDRARRNQDETDQPGLKPGLIFYPVGETTGAEILIQGPRGVVRITVEENADIRISRGA